MTLNGLFCADLSLRNYSLNHPVIIYIYDRTHLEILLRHMIGGRDV